MASKLMSRISDLKRKLSSRASTSSSSDFLRINSGNVRDNFDSDSAVMADGFFTNAYLERCSSADHSNSELILNTEISLLDAAASAASIIDGETEPPQRRTADDVWKEIVEGKKKEQQKKKQQPKEEMMTLEDFLVKAGAVEETVAVEVKDEAFSGGITTYENISSTYSGSVIGMGIGMGLDADGLGKGRGKRSLSLLEPLDKAAQQRQRRMIKNRESAARSRERKQAYQVELEAMAAKLEEENERLLKEKEERMKKRLKQLLENVIPVVEKRRPPRVLRKVHSMLW